MTDVPPPPPLTPPPGSEPGGYGYGGGGAPFGAPPPGYVAYGGSGAINGTFRRVGGVAKGLVILTAVALVVAAVVLAVQVGLRNSAIDYRNGTLTKSDFRDKISPFIALALVAGAVSLATLVLECIWSFRLSKNLQVLRRDGQVWKPGWGIGVWLLAGCTLGILPYFMLRELWQGSDPQTAPGDPSWKRSAVGQLVHVWFVLNLVSVAAGIAAGLSQATFGLGNSETNVARSLDTRIAFVSASGVISVITSIVFILLVRQLTARHVQATREA